MFWMNEWLYWVIKLSNYEWYPSFLFYLERTIGRRKGMGFLRGSELYFLWVWYRGRAECGRRLWGMKENNACVFPGGNLHHLKMRNGCCFKLLQYCYNSYNFRNIPFNIISFSKHLWLEYVMQSDHRANIAELFLWCDFALNYYFFFVKLLSMVLKYEIQN